jgi:hypothetical protein
MKRTLKAAAGAAGIVGLGLLAGSHLPPMHAQAPAFEPLKFHHVHLNSVDPEAAAAYYPKPFAKTATKTTFNGLPAVKTGHIYILFNKVNTPPQNELTGPQTSVWHFGWNTPNSREYNANFRKMGLTIAQMWNGSDADAKLVDLSGDVPTPPGGGFPTEEQVLELRAKGATVDPTKVPGGFGYLRGPDGVMIENAQSGNAERFNHVHMYHEHPRCAMEWYATHLGAQMPQGRGAGPGRGGDAAAPAGPVAGTSADCRNPHTIYSPPTFPSFAKGGFVRDPPGGVNFDDISISMRPWPGGGLAPTRGKLYDHWAVSTTSLDSTMTRLKGEGVKVLEDIHPWGSMRAAMIEGPDRIAIEIVEEKP